MSLLNGQMENKTPECFVIDSDENSEPEVADGDNWMIDLYEELLEVNNDSMNGTDSTTPHNNLNSSGLEADPLAECVPKEEENSSKEPFLDDFEFDFRTIDEAEQTEHILKVRVHANFCMRCGIGFVQKKKLNLHLEKNECSANNNISETPFTCSICGQGFFQNKCLRHHFMRHAQTRPFKCKKCDRSFATKREIYKHYRTHPDYRPFTCNLCPIAFIYSKRLIVHKSAMHIGKRPFDCKLCGKKFNCSKKLIAHKKRHASKKPFKCKFCSRKYAHKSMRNIHMATHTISNFAKLKYLCEICGLTHIRSKKSAARMERSNSEIQHYLYGDFFYGKNEKKPNGLPLAERKRTSSDSSDSVQIIEDPLRVTIDLVDDDGDD